MRWPHFLSGPLIGMDISSRWIAAVQVAAGGSPARVTAAACVARVGQGAPDASELSRIADVLDRRGFRVHNVVIAAPDDRLIMSPLELPLRSSGAPVADLARMELARTHKRDPRSFECALWDIPGEARPGETTGRYVAAGLGHDHASALLGAFDGARLHVRAIDVRAWAVARACAPKLGPGLSAVLDLGEPAAVLILIQNGVVAYQRTMPDAGVDALRSALAASLGLSPEVLEFVLGGAADTQEAPDLPDGASPIVESYVEAIAAEARTAVDYVSRRLDAAGLDRLLLVGSGARISAVARRIGDALSTPAPVVTPADVAPCPDPLARICSDPRLTVALGLSTYQERWARCAA